MRMNPILIPAVLGLAVVYGCENPQPREEPVQAPAVYSGTAEPDYYATHPLEEPPAEETTEPAEAAQAPPPSEPPAPRIHTVVEGDTLYNLARQYYNDQSRWKDIFEANRDLLSDPNTLTIGRELTIP